MVLTIIGFPLGLLLQAKLSVNPASKQASNTQQLIEAGPIKNRKIK